MKTKRIFLFCSFLWILYNPIKLEAQALKYTITYDSKVKHYARCAKGEEKLISDFDRLKMSTITEENRHQISVFNSNDIEITITHIKSDRFPSWITSAAKTVVDKNGVKSYDRDGKILVNLPHSEQSLEAYNQIKLTASERELNTFPSFNTISPNEEANLRSKGVKIKTVGNKITHMRQNDRELLYDSERKMVEERLFEGKNLKYSQLQRFQTELTGRVYPSYTKEINMTKNDKGRRFWNFKEETTTNYHFIAELQSRGASNTESINDKFTIFPNPTSKELWVQIPMNIKDKTPTLTIRDLVGRIVLTQKIIYTKQSVDIQQFTPGIYILQISTITGEKLVERFVKQ